MSEISGRVSRIGTRRDQTVSLTRAFLTRFFENEITAGTDDLKESFFWLMSFLAAPGVFAAVWMSWTWGFIATFRGVDALRIASSADKVLYVGFGMVASGLVTAIVWQSLLIDRRDGMVLGALPVGHRVVLQAKLLAVSAYIVLVALSMHVLASLGFGVFLASRNDAVFALRGIAAHFVASSLGSLFVFMCAIALQGSVLALVGARGFLRVSPLLQLGFVASVVLGLITLPALSVATPDTVWGGVAARPWIVFTPPVWFLGIYETVLGTQNASLLRLGHLGWTALAGAIALSAATYPVAYRRVMRDAVEHPEAGGRIRVAAAARWLPEVLARGGPTRAIAQFLLATVGRVERHRFVIALAAGAALAWAIPALVTWRSVLNGWTPADQRVVLALPVAAMILMLVGVRVAASVPSDLRAAWLFYAADPSPRSIRAGLRRVMAALVVVPSAVFAGVSAVLLWPPEIAGRHALFCLAAGLLTIECLSLDLDSVPCAAPWRPERANLRTRWPAYLLALVLVCGSGRYSLVSLELVSFRSAVWNAVLVAVIASTAVAVHWIAARRIPAPPDEQETFNAVGVLDLN